MTISTFFFLFFIAVVIIINIIIILLLLHGSEEFICWSLWSRTKLKTGSRHTSAHPWALFLSLSLSLSPLFCVSSLKSVKLYRVPHEYFARRLWRYRLDERNVMERSVSVSSSATVSWHEPNDLAFHPRPRSSNEKSAWNRKNAFDFLCRPTRKPA